MVFSSIDFLYVFLPVVLVLYWLVPRRLRNGVLLAASLLFYFVGERFYVLLLLFSSLSDWLHSLFIESRRGRPAAKYALISSIVINLGLLGFFKYTDFFVGLLNTVPGINLPLPGLHLPIGISFYTFQTMSYTIDVYRGRVHAQKNLATLATFVCLFPQLIAGPIVRYADITAELDERRVDLTALGQGLSRFVIGLAKKVLLANALGEFCSQFRAAGQPGVLFYWGYAVAFTLQIYFDFSGYSDMAIGLGRLFGFTFPENFNYPYVSRSITEFWRRWHMTLGSWFRDYVYIPLGGNRTRTRGQWLRNIAVVWLLTGLWHGAAWNFVLWGGLYGVLLVIEKLWLGRRLERLPVLSHVYVMLLVTLGFVIFNANGISGALSDLGGLVGWGSLPFFTAESWYYLKSYGLILLTAALCATPLLRRVMLWLRRKTPRLMTVAEPLILCLLLLAVTAYLVDGSFNPFLYFRF